MEVSISALSVGQAKACHLYTMDLVARAQLCKDADGSGHELMQTFSSVVRTLH